MTLNQNFELENKLFLSNSKYKNIIIFPERIDVFFGGKYKEFYLNENPIKNLSPDLSFKEIFAAVEKYIILL
jgi:hypothetical protein